MAGVAQFKRRCRRCYLLRPLDLYRTPSAKYCDPCEEAMSLATEDYRVDEDTPRKVRKCLKCDKQFMSYNDRRMCDFCNHHNRLYDGETYVIGR